MSIRYYIILSRLLLLSLICSAMIIGWLGVSQIQKSLERTTFSSKQLQTLYRINSSFHDMKVQIPHIIFQGAAPDETIKKHADTLSSLIASLNHTTRKEYDWLEGTPETAVEEEEKDRINKLSSLMDRTVKLVDRIIATRTDHPELAQRLFIQDLSGGLESQIDIVIQNSVSDEHSEINEAHLKIMNALFFYGAVCSALLMLAGLVQFATGFIADRSIVHPLRALSKTAADVTKGTNNARFHKSYLYEVTNLVEQFEMLINELARRRENMEQDRLRFEESTKEAEQEFHVSNRKLQKVIDMRARFLADIGHELKTPLTALKSEAEICLRNHGQEEVEYRTTLTRMKVLCEQVNIIVDDIYFLARSETETLHFEFTRSDIEGVISGVIHNYEIFGRENNNHVLVNWANEPAEVLSDVSKLKQAFGIVLDNAFKYSNPDLEIHVLVENTGSEVVIKITNTGQPIPREDLPYIFERYYRGKGVANKPGLGLGLGIARWIIEKHQGKINLTSTIKGVTEVTIILPKA